ncbi:MAG: LytTR family DNA-binding domain-containing protein, partial [Bacteroidota bacterium]
ESNWKSYFLLLTEFTTVMIIPFTLYFLIKSKEANKRKQKQMLVFTSENGKDQYAIQAQKVLYVKAEDNYVKVVYKNGKQEDAFMLRKKLSDIEKSFPSLVRVHRSYLINTENVFKVEQNSKSTVVHFDTGSSLPSSSKYKSVLSTFLNHHI